MYKNKKGFTLIELLVVIAIIGILSSVVIVSLSSSNSKAKAAAFQKEIKSLVSSFNNKCVSGTIVLGDIPANPKTFAQSDALPDAQSCGTTGAGVWGFTVDATNGAISTSNQANCNSDGCTFN